MEELASTEIGRGFNIGVRNSRGAHFHRADGEEERELAAKYRAWAENLRFDYPYVGGVLDDIAASYDFDAGWHASEAKVRKRLRN